MDYSKVQHSFTRTALFKGSDAASKGVWLSLHIHCADQENGGVIRACRAWTDRHWYSIADATKAEVDASIAQGMARWEGDDLHLNGYDSIGEATYKATCEENRYRAECRWAKERGLPPPERKVPRGTMPAALPPALPAALPEAVPDVVPPAMPNPVQSKPVQSNPPTPQPPAVAGQAGAGERRPTKEENTAALERLLRKLIVATGPQATPRWAGLAEQAKVGSLDEALECVEWLITTARGQGVKVEYASDVLPFLERWKWHKAELRRKAKVQAGTEASEAVAS